jgi:hypothetical protein
LQIKKRPFEEKEKKHKPQREHQGEGVKLGAPKGGGEGEPEALETLRIQEWEFEP